MCLAVLRKDQAMAALRPGPDCLARIFLHLTAVVFMSSCHSPGCLCPDRFIPAGLLPSGALNLDAVHLGSFGHTVP